MKELEDLNSTRLSQLEFGQHLKSICTNIDSLGEGFVTDVLFLNYLNKLKQCSEDYDEAMMPVKKSDETAKIVAADMRRDRAFWTLKRMLKVFEFSENPAEVDAFASLNTLFRMFKNIHRWNYESKTNGLDALLTDLGEPRYSGSIGLLDMGAFVLRVETANSAFKNVFSGRTLKQARKTVYDTKALRREAKTAYDIFINYVLTMAIALDTEQYNRPLRVINTLRKYYSDLLAKRIGVSKEGEKLMEITVSPN